MTDWLANQRTNQHTNKKHAYIHTYSMQLVPPWEANTFTSSKEVTDVLWEPKLHYHVQTILPLVHIHIILVYYLLISWRLILILSSHLRLGRQSCLFSLWFPHQNPVRISPIPCTCYIPLPSISSSFAHPNNICQGVKTLELLLM
jgi:hypothetical protein